MQIKIFRTYNDENKKLYTDIMKLTMPVSVSYPGYVHWYKNVFLPGVVKGERLVIVAFDRNNHPIGCALLKKAKDEKKICTLFVSASYRRIGVGSMLIQMALVELKEYPHITVSSKNINQFYPLLKKMGFRLSAVKKGVYTENTSEFYFNDKKADLIKDGLVPVLMRIKSVYKTRH